MNNTIKRLPSGDFEVIKQPEDCVLLAALDRARKYGGLAFVDLKRVRYERTTWYGRDELALRKEIDTFIDEASRDLCTNGR